MTVSARWRRTSRIRQRRRRRVTMRLAAPSQPSAVQPPAGTNPMDRQSAKVKALKLQDGDITTQ